MQGDDILKLHSSIQGCFKYLDERIYKAVNSQPISHTVIVERDNKKLLDERNSLMESVEQIRNDYDKVCGKYMELHKKYQNELKKSEMLKQEVDTQQELLKQYKLALIRDRVTDLPVPDYNIYKGVKCYIKNNESSFSLFLGTILHQVKNEKMINLENLLTQIDKYYKQPKVKISPQKLSITQSNEERLPRISNQKVEKIKYKLKPIRNESLQLKAISIERGERSRSFY